MLIIKRPKNKYEIYYPGNDGYNEVVMYRYFQGSLIPTQAQYSSQPINTKLFQGYLQSDIRKKRIDSDEFFADRATKLLREVSPDFFEILEIYNLDADKIRKLGIMLNEGFVVEVSTPGTIKQLCTPRYWTYYQAHNESVFINYHGKNILASDSIEEKVNGMGRVNRLYAFLDTETLWCDPLMCLDEHGGSSSFYILKGGRERSAIMGGIQMWEFDIDPIARYCYEEAFTRDIEDIECFHKKFDKIVKLAREFGLEVIVNRNENKTKVNLWDHTAVNHSRINHSRIKDKKHPVQTITFELGVGVNQINDENVTNFGRAIIKYLSENPGLEPP